MVSTWYCYRVGSIVVNCTIVCSEKDDTVSSELYAAILELQNGSYSIFDGQTVDVSTGNICRWITEDITSMCI